MLLLLVRRSVIELCERGEQKECFFAMAVGGGWVLKLRRLMQALMHCLHYLKLHVTFLQYAICGRARNFQLNINS